MSLFNAFKNNKAPYSKPKNFSEKRNGWVIRLNAEKYTQTQVELRFKNDGQIKVVEVEGVRSVGLATDYFIKENIDAFIQVLQTVFGQNFSHLKNRQDVTALFVRPVFRIITSQGQCRNLLYTGFRRFSPNESPFLGRGEDVWMYLCEEEGKHYILTFFDTASGRTGWSCSSVLPEDFPLLLARPPAFWKGVANSKQRQKISGITLSEADGVRYLLPSFSRYRKTLTEKQFLG